MSKLLLASLLVGSTAFAGYCPESQVLGAAKSVVPAAYNCFIHASTEVFATSTAEKHKVYYRCSEANYRDQYNEVHLRIDAETGYCMPTLITTLRRVR